MPKDRKPTISLAQARDAMAHVYKLDGYGFFTVESAKNHQPVFRATLTSALIELNEVLKFLAASGQRIDCKGDDIQPVLNEGDLTSLIAACRNAACHLDSNHRHVESRRSFVLSASWNLVFGRGPPPIGGESIIAMPSSPFDDDWAVYMGGIRLLMVRNFRCAVNKADVALKAMR
ncbi:MAG: hypothetical protein R3E02_02190 [Blastomonas sp.]